MAAIRLVLRAMHLYLIIRCVLELFSAISFLLDIPQKVSLSFPPKFEDLAANRQSHLSNVNGWRRSLRGPISRKSPAQRAEAMSISGLLFLSLAFLGLPKELANPSRAVVLRWPAMIPGLALSSGPLPHKARTPASCDRKLILRALGQCSHPVRN